MKFLNYYCLYVLIFLSLMVSCEKSDEDLLENNSSETGIGSVDGHDYVDLGLSVKWATCNIGARSESDFGNYYAWGETITKTSYYDDTYKYFNSSKWTFSSIGNNISGTKYDAATLYWGDKWRMPTKKEMEELISKCTWEWESVSNVSGYKIIGPNGNAIFLPAGGMFWGDEREAKAGIFGQYWSSIFKETTDFYSHSYTLQFTKNGKEITGGGRAGGLNIRPVTTAKGDEGNDDSGNDDSGNGTTTSEKPEVGFYDFTATKTSLKVQYKIYNKDEAGVKSAKIYYGTTSNPTTSKTASVSGTLITANITGLKAGTTYYVKCSVTGKAGTTRTEVTKCITNY